MRGLCRGAATVKLTDVQLCRDGCTSRRDVQPRIVERGVTEWCIAKLLWRKCKSELGALATPGAPALLRSTGKLATLAPTWRPEVLVFLSYTW